MGESEEHSIVEHEEKNVKVDQDEKEEKEQDEQQESEETVSPPPDSKKKDGQQESEKSVSPLPDSKKRKRSVRSSSPNHYETRSKQQRKGRKGPKTPRSSTTPSTRSPRPRATSPKKGTSGAAWTPEEDKILIDNILELLPPIPWSTIVTKLPERNTKSLQNRWQSLKKKLHA